MTLDHPTVAFTRFYGDVMEASADRQRLKHLRRQIRDNRHLHEDERTELLEAAQYVPGCKPGPVSLLAVSS
jgi:hypothetical protein